jgi:signal transduction histidine kinase/CheY-like chemotaxis protein
VQKRLNQFGAMALEWLALSDARHDRVDEQRLEDIMQSTYARGDRIVEGFLIGHLVLAALLSLVHDTWAMTALVAPATLAMFMISARLAPRGYITRVIAGVCFSIFVSLHIVQLGGHVGLQALYMIPLTVMIVYQDPRCMWHGSAMTVVTSGTLGLAQMLGQPVVYFGNMTPSPMHFAIMWLVLAGHTLICSWWALLLKRNSVTNFIRQEDLVRSREQLRAAKMQAEQASESKSSFLANMSHEIRTPMTAILGYADLLADEEATPTSQSRADVVRTIQRNGEHLIQIINDILDISKIEAGRLGVEHIDVSPLEMLDEVHELLENRATSKGLQLKLEYMWPLPVKISSDPVRLKQILVNLAGNAIKFTGSGSVTLRVRCDAKLEMLSIDVMDTGIGMDKKGLANLFQAFSQAEASTTRKFGGTGLGLTISRRLANLLGGDITVDSVKGKGSTFTVSVATGNMSGVEWLQSSPTPKQELTDEPKRVIDLPLSGGRILLAEDGLDNQRLIAFHLTRAGANVEIANNGLIAMEKALTASRAGMGFDIVLMDIEMPEMDGLTATRNLRESRYDGKIVALTAHAMAGDRDRCLEAGCDDYLTKPINKQKLIEMCTQSVLARKVERRLAA